jgi:stage IV sporulation protein FB
MDTPEEFEMNTGGENPLPAAEETIYPPRYEKPEQPTHALLKSISSLAVYLFLGYYIFPSYKILLVVTAIVLIHEMGHFIAMKAFRYNELGIFFIPLLGAYVSGSKREVSQWQSAVILLAGPLPGIILGIVGYLLDQQSQDGIFIAGLSLSRISMFFIILNIINLFPVYPLDGGQLLNRVFLDEDGTWSKIFIFLSTGLLTWFSISIPFYPLLIFPTMMLFRYFSDSKTNHVEKKIDAAGLNTDVDYAELPAADYWKIRDIVIQEYPQFRDIPPGPPYAYHPKEEKIMTTVESFLHRHLLQDVSHLGKVLIFIVWVAAFAAPWLLKMDMGFLRQFGI